MGLSRRNFVLLTGGLAASVPFLGNGVAEATQALERATRPPSVAGSEGGLGAGDAIQNKLIPVEHDRVEPESAALVMRGASFIVSEVNVSKETIDSHSYGDSWGAKMIDIGMVDVEVRLRSSGPISKEVLSVLMECPEIEFYVPDKQAIEATRTVSSGRTYFASASFAGMSSGAYDLTWPSSSGVVYEYGSGASWPKSTISARVHRRGR